MSIEVVGVSSAVIVLYLTQTFDRAMYIPHSSAI